MDFMPVKKVIAVFFVLTVLSASVFSQSNSISRDSLLGQINTITTAVPFLLIAPDARAGAMGDAGVATTADANSIHWNPAKLAFVEKNIGFSVSYTPWLRALVPDIYLGYLAGYKKLKNDQTLGISLLYFSLGDITFTDNAGNITGQFNPKELSVDVAYARKLGDDFSGGLALRYINSNLTGGAFLPSGSYSHAGNSVAADISVYYHKEVDLSNKKSIFTSGVNISNIGSKISYTESGNKDFIPTNFRLGAGLKTELDEYNTLTFTADINKLLVPTPPVYLKDASGKDSVDDGGNKIVLYGKDPNVSVAGAIFSSWGDAPGGFAEELKEFTYSLGLEYWYDKQFAIRAGYFHEAETKGNRQFFTVGAGVKYNVFGIDFAYLIPTQQKHPLENTLRFTLLIDFDSLKGSSDSGGEEKTE
jgi:hypothetical protein